MKKNIVDVFLAFFVLIIFFFFKIIGIKLSSNICAFIFSKVGPKTKFNKIAEKNITYVWPTKSKKDVYKIISGMWKNIGRNFGELVHIKSFGSFKKKKIENFRR